MENRRLYIKCVKINTFHTKARGIFVCITVISIQFSSYSKTEEEDKKINGFFSIAVYCCWIENKFRVLLVRSCKTNQSIRPHFPTNFLSSFFFFTEFSHLYGFSTIIITYIIVGAHYRYIDVSVWILLCVLYIFFILTIHMNCLVMLAHRNTLHICDRRKFLCWLSLQIKKDSTRNKIGMGNSRIFPHSF